MYVIGKSVYNRNGIPVRRFIYSHMPLTTHGITEDGHFSLTLQLSTSGKSVALWVANFARKVFVAPQQNKSF